MSVPIRHAAELFPVVSPPESGTVSSVHPDSADQVVAAFVSWAANTTPAFCSLANAARVVEAVALASPELNECWTMGLVVEAPVMTRTMAWQPKASSGWVTVTISDAPRPTDHQAVMRRNGLAVVS